MSDFYLGETSYQEHINKDNSSADFDQYNVPISELIFGNQNNDSNSSSHNRSSQIGYFDFNQTTHNSSDGHQGQYQGSRAEGSCRDGNGRSYDRNTYHRPIQSDYQPSHRIDNRFVQRDIGCNTQPVRHDIREQLEYAARQSFNNRNRSPVNEIDYINELVRTGQLPASTVNSRFRNSPGFIGESCTPIRWNDRRQDIPYQPRDSRRHDYPRDRRVDIPYIPDQHYRPRQDHYRPSINHPPRDYRLDDRHRPREDYYRPRHEPDCYPGNYRPDHRDRYYPGRGHQDTGDFIKGMILDKVLGGNRYQPYNRYEPYNRYQPRYYPQHQRPGNYYPGQNYRSNDVGRQIASFVIPMVINRIQSSHYRGRYRH